jgi:hypothetical protein
MEIHVLASNHIEQSSVLDNDIIHLVQTVATQQTTLTSRESEESNKMRTIVSLAGTQYWRRAGTE